MKSIAIVGTGIAGLACAHKLQNNCKVTLFERNDYVGGHTNTVIVPEGQSHIPIDTGFMVFNEVTYPNLTRLFRELSVPVKKTDMSFSVQLRQSKAHKDIEWGGSSLDQLFGQRKNIFSAKFLRMVFDLCRFNQIAESDYEKSDWENITIEDYVKQKKFGRDLLDLYLMPMASSLWSSPPEAMKNLPARTVLQFFHNHRLNSGLNGHLQWLTPDGGSIQYVDRITKPFRQSIKLNAPISKISLSQDGVIVQTVNGENTEFDLVIIATHADEALAFLEKPNHLEREILSTFRYTRNSVQLHTDEAVMPKTRKCWASWNYRTDTQDEETKSSVHYWMNNLQNVSQNKNYFVSLNADWLVDPKKILKRMTYTHPTFSMESIRAQKEIHYLNKQSKQRIFFCGSYFGYGFHEDALNSALELCENLKL